MSRTSNTEWPEVSEERNCISERGPSLVSLSEDVTIPDSVLDDSGICFPDDGKFNGEFFEFLINFPFRKFSAENGKWKAEFRGKRKALPISGSNEYFPSFCNR